MIIKTEKLKPANNKIENIYVGLTVLLIVIVATIGLQFVKSNNTQVVDNTVIESRDLSTQNNSIFSNIELFLHDLPTLIEDNKAPSVESLQEEYAYPPFTHDATWQATGELKWYLIMHHNNVFYVGISQDKKVASDFIVEYNMENKKSTVKIKDNFSSFKPNMSGHELEAEVKDFKTIKAYTGKSMMEDVKK